MEVRSVRISAILQDTFSDVLGTDFDLNHRILVQIRTVGRSSTEYLSK